MDIVGLLIGILWINLIVQYNKNNKDKIDNIYYVDNNGMNTGMVNLPYQKKQL